MRIDFNHSQEDLIKAHNAKYNPRGVKRGGASDEQAAETNQPAAKRICLEKTMALSDESSIADKYLGSSSLEDPSCFLGVGLTPTFIVILLEL